MIITVSTDGMRFNKYECVSRELPMLNREGTTFSLWLYADRYRLCVKKAAYAVVYWQLNYAIIATKLIYVFLRYRIKIRLKYLKLTRRRV